MEKSRKSLKEKGWMFQFVADETLAKDAGEIYDLLGYEVHLQPPNQSHSRKVILLQRNLKGKDTRGGGNIVPCFRRDDVFTLDGGDRNAYLRISV